MYTQIDHIGAPTWDADQAASFFELAGIPIAFEDQIDEYNIRAVFLDIDGVYLEFLEPTGEGVAKEFLERHGPGFDHVAYRVPDIDEAVETLRESGVEFQSDAPTPGAGDARIIFVEERHTSGFTTELVERND